MSKVTVDTRELDKFAVLIEKYPTKATNNVRDAVRTSTLNVESNAKKNLTNNKSVDTGLLRNSINSKISTFEGVVSTNTKYARIVEEGSRPHIIRPKKKKALYWAGASHPVRQVNHPGTKPKPYMIPAFEKEIPIFLKNMEKAVDLD